MKIQFWYLFFYDLTDWQWYYLTFHNFLTTRCIIASILILLYPILPLQIINVDHSRVKRSIIIPRNQGLTKAFTSGNLRCGFSCSSFGATQKCSSNGIERLRGGSHLFKWNIFPWKVEYLNTETDWTLPLVQSWKTFTRPDEFTHSTWRKDVLECQ